MANVAIADAKNVDYLYDHFVDLSDSLLFYCSAACPNPNRFLANTLEEIEGLYKERQRELDLNCSLSLLASVEATFRVDYLLRCRKKKKDSLSLNLRLLYRKKKEKASLEDDILEAWKENTTAPRYLVGDIIGALRFRHWIAHGRYWDQNLGKTYDFISLYSLANAVLSSFPFETP